MSEFNVNTKSGFVRVKKILRIDIRQTKDLINDGQCYIT